MLELILLLLYSFNLMHIYGIQINVFEFFVTGFFSDVSLLFLAELFCPSILYYQSTLCDQAMWLTNGNKHVTNKHNTVFSILLPATGKELTSIALPKN